MKECMECRKKLGFLNYYRHPTMGEEYVVCGECFDTVYESVEKYREFISPYIGFFNEDTSVREDIQKFTRNLTKNIKKMCNGTINLLFHKTNPNVKETISIKN